MSEEQQKLVTDNINLIFYYMHKHRLNLEDKDVGYIALCKAAKGYNPELKIAFSSYALRCIHNEFQIEHLRKNRLKTIPESNIKNPVDEKLDLFDNIKYKQPHLDSLIYREFTSNLEEFLLLHCKNERERTIMESKIHPGLYTQKELSEKFGVKQAQISRVGKRLCKKFIDKYYKDTTLNDLLEEMRGDY